MASSEAEASILAGPEGANALLPLIRDLGSSAEPYRDNNVWWVFERCISLPAEPPAWRLKEQIRPPADETAS